ncbi:phosphoserine phosphatase SerB [Nocardioides bruguierae]|uniref:phosphoserine phosphatase n=1 Tax=Nocardioides bruguierae TaxID=2945102 RepID=A0A9X2D4L7_9ACTN|nr:phosphoserine phosphatase SerB [Nocardioides bruguierae]MCL8025819.1 phosphoserine phosphatase SerB [Nocardioides bruguierae]MCM0618934.1 phosphoserine phosphatase SerB [Nocardioides bruguierae]
MSEQPAVPAATPRPDSHTLLVTLSGRDRPGVTSAILATLAEHGGTVVDLDQIVLRRRLILGVLVAVEGDTAPITAAVAGTAARLEMSVEVEPGTGLTVAPKAGRAHVTVLGTPLSAAAMSGITSTIAEAGANIDRIQRLASYPVTAIDLHVSGAAPERLRELLATEAARQQIDVAVQPAGMLRRGMRLIVMDVDSTLIQGEVIEMIAAHAGCEAEVAEVTERAMRGELDFEESLRARVALLEGVPASALHEVYDSIELAPGARTMVRTLRRLGYRFAIVSGGFTQITDRLAVDLGIHYARANQLEIVDGRLTGRVVGQVVDRAAKATALREFAAQVGVEPDATVAIGDGANDLDMLAAAGLGIAYNAKPMVRERADTAVNVPYLDTIMYLLGITREEIEAADAAAGITTPAPPLG